MCESVVGDGGAGEPEDFELFEGLEMFHSTAGDAGVSESQRTQPGSGRDVVPQRVVGDGCRGEVQNGEGVELGEVLSITELSGFLPIKVRAEFDAEVTSVPVQSGELSVTAQVQVVFKIR